MLSAPFFTMAKILKKSGLHDEKNQLIIIFNYWIIFPTTTTEIKSTNLSRDEEKTKKYTTINERNLTRRGVNTCQAQVILQKQK